MATHITTAATAAACNIGPAELAQRRRAALGGIVVSIVLTATTVAAGVPAPARLWLALPYAGTLVAILQVVRRVCVAFAARGIRNFGALGEATAADRVAAAAARHEAMRMTAASIVGGIILGVVVALLPV